MSFLSQNDSFPLASFSPGVDMSRLIYDTSSAFNPLNTKSLIGFHVERIEGDLAVLNVAIPYELVRFYVSLLESMTGCFQVMRHRVKSSVAEEKVKKRTHDPVAIDLARQSREKFQKTVCALYEKNLNDGLSQNESISRTNKTLKLKEHPWATYEIIKGVLSSQGYFRAKKSKGTKKEVNS